MQRNKTKAMVPKGFWAEEAVAKKNKGFQKFIDERKKQNIYYKDKYQIPNQKNSRAIIYTEYIKEIVKKVPGIATAISQFSRSKEKRYIDPKERFEILDVTNQMLDRGEIGSLKLKNNKAILITIHSPIKKTIFIKKKGHLNKNRTIGEMLAQNVLKKIGIKTIDSHAAYYSVDAEKHSTTSMVAYDFTNLMSFEDAVIKGHIMDEKYEAAYAKMEAINKKIKDNKLLISDYGAAGHFFIDLKTGELYIFDPYVETFSDFKKLYNIAEKKLNLKIKWSYSSFPLNFLSKRYFILSAFFGPSISTFWRSSKDAFATFFNVLNSRRIDFARVGPTSGNDSKINYCLSEKFIFVFEYLSFETLLPLPSCSFFAMV